MSTTPSPRHGRVLALLALFLVGAVPLAAGESRWYLNGKIGEANLETRFGVRHPQFFDGSDETSSVEVGYVLRRYLAVQAGYHELGTFRGYGSPCPEDTEVCPEYLALAAGLPRPEDQYLPLIAVLMKAELSGLSLSLVPRWPIGEQFLLYAKVGVLDWDSEVSGGPGVGRIGRYSDRDLMTGVGAQYVFPRGVGVLVEYQKIDIDHESTSLGASWRF